MDFRIIDLDGCEVLLHRSVENENQFVLIKTFIKGDVDDPERMYEETIQFPSRTLAMDFIWNFSQESAQNWVDELE